MTPNPRDALKTTIYNTKHTNNTKTHIKNPKLSNFSTKTNFIQYRNCIIDILYILYILYIWVALSTLLASVWQAFGILLHLAGNFAGPS